MKLEFQGKGFGLEIVNLPLGLHAKVKECWAPVDDFKSMYPAPQPDRDMLHCISLESIAVEPLFQRLGMCREFIESLCNLPEYEMVIVEGVQNAVLARALERWGWRVDRSIMDFYWLHDWDAFYEKRCDRR